MLFKKGSSCVFQDKYGQLRVGKALEFARMSAHLPWRKAQAALALLPAAVSKGFLSNR